MHAVRAWLLALVALLSLPIAAARAEEPQGTARAQFAVGLAHAQRGDWPAAMSAFQLAYQAVADTTVLFNLAGAQLRCGKLLASNTNYRRVLASAGDSLSRPQRVALQKQIRLIERRMPRLRVHIQGLQGEDRVLLDQARLYPDELDRDMWLDPGTHRLEIIHARGKPEERTVILAEGEMRVLALALP